MKNNTSKWIGKIILFVFILLSSVWTSYFLNFNQPVLTIAAATAVYYLYSKMSLNHSIRSNWVILLYSLLFSLAFVMGKQVNYVWIRSSMSENYIVIGKKSILTVLTFAILIYPVFQKISELISVKKIKRADEKKALKDPLFFVISWLIIFVFWLPYLLTFYPGGIVGDGAQTLRYAMTPGVLLHNHWVVLYILVLRFFLWLGKLISPDVNVGVFLYVLCESIVFSGVCAFVCYSIRKKGAPLFLQWGSVFMYSISGFFASYSISLWKDTIFAAAIVLFVILLWDLPTDGKIPVGYCIKFGLLALFMCFWRNNGLHIFLFILLGILLFYRKKVLKLLIPGVLVFLCTVIIQGPVYNALGVEKDTFVDFLSVPMQQIAAVIGENRNLSDSQQEILFNIISEEDWKNRYSPTISDNLKDAVNKDYLQSHLKDFLLVWAQLLIPNFFTYVRAYMMQTLGFWQPGVFLGGYLDYWIGIQDLFDAGYVNRDFIEEITGVSVKEDLISMIKFIPSGTIVWIMWFSFTAIFNQSEKKKRLMLFLPLIVSWLVVMLATPIAYYYRYIFMIPTALPIIVYLPFWNETNASTTENISTTSND